MDGKRPAALVTGSGTGIGRAAVLALAKAGYDVAVNYSRSADAAQKTATECEALGVKAIVPFKSARSVSLRSRRRKRRSAD